MNEELLARIDELVAMSSRLLARSERLEMQVESLQSQVEKLDKRLAYRETVVVGWQAIANRVGFDDADAARRAGKRNFDPLPAVKQHHTFVAHATALDAWKERQKDYRRSGLTFDAEGNLIPDRRMKPRLVPRETGETPS